MRILVTGSAGFIGFHLTDLLLKLGHEVIGIDNINNYYDVNLKYARLNELGVVTSDIQYETCTPSKKYPKHSFFKIDLIDKIAIDTLFRTYTFDCVCNLAAQAGVRYSIENPQSYIESNIVGFLNILEACRHNKISHLVYASSSSVYGLNKKQPFSTDDSVDYPISLYAASKKSNELMAHSYSHLYKFATTGLRFFTVYGPWGRPDMAPMLFADAICSNKAIKVFNYGDLERDFTYIDDIVTGVVNIITKSNVNSTRLDKYKIYNIGNNRPVKLLDFISTMENALGMSAIKEFLPMQAGDVYSTFADIDPLQKDFEYSPSTNIDVGINKFAKWFLEYYKK